MAFDPDAYLEKTAPQETKAFDPDAYLSQAPAPEAESPAEKPSILAGTKLAPEQRITPFNSPADLESVPKFDVSQMPTAEDRAAAEFGISPEMGMGEKALRTAKGSLYGASKGLEQTWLGGARMISDITGLGKEGVEGVSKQVSKEQAAVDKTYEANYGLNIARNIGSSVVQNLPIMGIGLTTGTAGALTSMFTQSFMQTYDDSRNEGLGVGASTARSALYGTAEALGESIGLPNLLKGAKDALKGVPTAQLAGDIAKYMVKEIPGEQLTYISQFLTDKGFNMNPEAGLTEFLQGMKDTALVTVGQTAVMGGAGFATNKVLKDLRDHHSKGEDGIPKAADMVKEAGFNFNRPAATPEAPITPEAAAPEAAVPQAVTQQATELPPMVAPTVPESQNKDIMMAELEGRPIPPERPEVPPVVAPAAAAPIPKEQTIGEQTQSQLKDLYKQQGSLLKQKDDLNVFLRKNGINTQDRSDMGIQPSESRNYAGVFRNKAQRLDVLMHSAMEKGIISEADLARFPDAVEGFRQMAKDAIDGNVAQTPQNMANMAQMKSLQDQIDSLESIPKEQYGLKAETAEETQSRIKQEAAARKAQEDAAIQADMDAQAERDRAEIARRSAEQSQNFGLGQTPEESLTGQQRLDDDIPFFSMARPNAKPYTKQVANAERLLNEKIDELKRLNTSRTAIKNRFETERIKPTDQMIASQLRKKAKLIEDEIDTLKWETRNNSAEKFLKRATDALANNEIDRDVYDVIHDIYVKEPNLLEGLKLRVIQGTPPSDIQSFQAAGEFVGRIVKLYKDTSGVEDPSVVRHELTHSLEQVMPKDAKKKLVQEWRNALDKAQAKERTPEGKAFFKALLGHLNNPTKDSFTKASEMMPTGKKDYYYQFMSPSEYWAVNAEKLLKARLGGTWEKFKNFVNKLYQSLKNLFGFDNTSLIHKTFEQVIKGKREGIGMLTDLQRGAVPTRAIDVSKNEAFKKWFGDSKVVNEDGSPKVVYHGTDKPDFSIFNPASWFSENKQESSMYARPGDLKTRERLLNKYKLSNDTSAVGKRVPMASVLQDFGKLEEGKLYAEGGEDGPVYKYLGNNKFEVLSNVVVDLDNATENSDGSYDILLKEGRSQQAIDLIQETKDYAQQEYPGGENGRVYPVYLSIKNPLRLSTLEANRFSERLGMSKKDILDQVKKWKAQGYDGIITSSDEATTSIDVRDAFGGIPEQYIPFDSNQVKSAIGNQGSFNPQDQNITLSMQPTKHKNYLGEPAPLSQWDMPTDSKTERFIYRIQDKYIDTKRAIQAIKDQVGEIADKWDAYLKEELYHGRTAKKTQDFLNDELLPIVKEMHKSNINLPEFDEYLHNRHAEERNIQIAKINPAMPDSGSGIATQDSKDYLAKLDPAKAKSLENMAKQIDKIIQKTQKILVNAGLESQDTIDIWNKTYKKYVPLMREDLDFSQKFGGTGAGFSTKGGSSKRAVGSLKEVADIFANVASQRERAIVRAEKARVGTALYGLAIQNPNPEFWLAVNPDAIKNEAALIKELQAMGLDAQDAKSIIQEPKTPYIDEKTGLVAYRVNPLLRNSDNVFPVRIDGKDRFIFFNPNDERAMRMVSAIKNLDAEGLGLILGNAAKVTRWIASVNTQYNPVFGAYNFLRDVGGAQFNLTTTPIAGKQTTVIKHVFPALKGIYKDLRSERAGEGAASGEWAQLWEEFQREGGATGYRDQFSKGKDELNIIERQIEGLNHGRIREGAKAVFDWLSDYNDALENAVRLSAYKVAIDQGISKERAASIAKNLTVNFNRKGAWSQQAGALYAFFNASVQGSVRLAETLKGPQGRKIIAGGLLLGSIQAIALAMAGFGDDDPPEFVKERNLVIPLPGKKYIAIPMPLGLHVIPNIGRLTTEMVLNGGKGSAKKIANLTGVMMDSFNPVGNAGLSMQTLSPTALDPMAAIMENRDSFGRPIAKEDRATNPTPGYTRSRDTASFISKELSKFLNYASGGTKYQKGVISPTPDQLDFLIGQATGGVGREVMKAEQAVTSLATGEELPSYKIPMVGKFYGDVASQASQANKFYDNITNMANHENEIKGRTKNREDVNSYYRDHPEARLYTQANTVENEITKINKEKKEALERNAPAAVIKRIEDRKTDVMRRFNEKVAKAER